MAKNAQIEINGLKCPSAGGRGLGGAYQGRKNSIFDDHPPPFFCLLFLLLQPRARLATSYVYSTLYVVNRTSRRNSAAGEAGTSEIEVSRENFGPYCAGLRPGFYINDNASYWLALQLTLSSQL